MLDSASCPPVPVRDEHMVALPQGEGMVFGLCSLEPDSASQQPWASLSQCGMDGQSFSCCILI